MKDNKKFQITGSASHWFVNNFPHRCDGTVIKEGDDFVEWSIDDNLGEGYTYEEALKKLQQRADRNGDLFYYDAESDDEDERPEMIIEIEEDEDEDGEPIEVEVEVLPKWYKGAGYYSCDNNAELLNGERSYNENGVTIGIDEL